MKHQVGSCITKINDFIELNFMYVDWSVKRPSYFNTVTYNLVDYFYFSNFAIMYCIQP